MSLPLPADASEAAQARGLSGPLRARVARGYFLAAAVLSMASAIVLSSWYPGLDPVRRVATGASFLSLGLLCALAMRGHDPRLWVAWVAAGAVAVMGLTAFALGWGLGAPGMAFLGLVVCMTASVGGLRQALCVAALAVAVVLALAWGHAVGAMPMAPVGLGPNALGLRVGVNLAAILMGLMGGGVVGTLVSRHVRTASEREARFRGLLAIATDAYWEIDGQYRLVALSFRRSRDAELRNPEPFHCKGRLPWEIAAFHMDAETLDLLWAEMDARQRFRDLPMQWRDEGGNARHFVVSGEPRLNSRGQFLGYWGAARDVTDQVRSAQALEATEQRYQQLFLHLPSPLVLHESGRVLDANPAALRLFGYTDLAAIIGQDLLQSYEEGDSRERERTRLTGLMSQPVGEALAVGEFHVMGAVGRRTLVRATAVRVEGDERPVALSIYVDDTDRRAAEDAVRRSEAMLSHLVATSPDLITLVELDTGRLTMVNQTFERLTGYRAAEVSGSNSQELSLWHDPALRASVFDRLRRQGQVTDIPVVFNAKDGSLVSLQLSGVRFAMNQRDYVVVNARDVSVAQRDRMEREAILENASIGIAFTRDRRFVLANPRFEQMFGWPAHSLAGQPARVMWRSDEEYLEVGLRIGALLARGEAATFEQRVQRPDGSSFLARMAARAIDPKRPAASGTIWIVDDVTEERRVEQALERARDAAEAANRAKSAFLANTSHELRTPLNGLTGLARLAATPGLEPARRDQYLRQIVDSAQALAAIISDILDLSKIEAGKLTLEHNAFGLGGLLREVHRSHLVLADPRGLALTLELPSELTAQAANDEALPHDITVLGDALRLRQILGNFLANALKFTAQGAVRLVALRVAAGRWRFEVHDTGPGIDADSQARLFQPFTQADESTTRRYGGTGLGLSICRELADLMGGEVGVVSQQGQGSCFWCELPLPQAAAMAPLLPVQARDPAVALRGRRVLVVEDNAVNMLICVALLEQWAVVVTQARDGAEAIELVERAAQVGLPFAAVLMDVQMPGMGGHEATRRLRERHPAEELPVIALTAAALVTEREAALAAGMDDFLTKPIDADRLCETLTRWVLR